MLITCASSTETELAFVGDLAFLLGASASSSGMIQPLAAASREAERHILNDPNGVIRRQIYQETVAGHGSPRLMLSRTPVLGVQRLFDGTDTGTATEYCSTDYRIEDAEAGFLTLTGVSLFARDWIWGQDIQVYPVPNAEDRRWLAVYEAGWQLTSNSSTCMVSTTTGPTLPDDIQRAVLVRAAELYEGGGGPIASMKVGPLGVNYRTEGIDEFMRLLAPYRRPA